MGAPGATGTGTATAATPPAAKAPTGTGLTANQLSYDDTGVGKTREWTIKVNPDQVLIVGGYGLNGVSRGVYRAYPGGTATIRVFDGFYSLVSAGNANEQWCFRIGQAEDFGWAHQIEEPLVGWTSCDQYRTQSNRQAPSVKAAGPTDRQETGLGKTLPFDKGAHVAGTRITLEDGTKFDQCSFSSAPQKGTVFTGVINPFPGEELNPCP